MSKKRETGQRQMFDPQPSLIEADEEELNDKVRRLLRNMRLFRNRVFTKMEERPAEDGPTTARHS